MPKKRSQDYKVSEPQLSAVNGDMPSTSHLYPIAAINEMNNFPASQGFSNIQSEQHAPISNLDSFPSSTKKVQPSKCSSKTVSIGGCQIELWILIVIITGIVIILLACIIVPVIMVMRNKYTNQTAETEPNSSTTTIVSTNMPTTGQLPSWTGTFSITSSSCSQLQCCCLVDNIVLTQQTSTKISISFSLYGTCGTMPSLAVLGTYSNGYTMLVTLYESPYYFSLSSDSNTLQLINLGSSACSATATRLFSTTFIYPSTSSIYTTTSANVLNNSIPATSISTSTSTSTGTIITTVSGTITTTGAITTTVSSTTRTVILATSTINQRLPWPGTFNLRSSCSRWQCCCPINTVTITQVAFDRMTISTTLGGFTLLCFGYSGPQTLEVTYPTQYSLSLSIYSIGYDIVLSSDGTTITLTNSNNDACGETGTRSGVGH